MIEDLLQDKKNLSAKVEELIHQMQENAVRMEKQTKWQDERLQVELRKNKEAWQASEKVRKEKWEKDKIHEIRAQTIKGIEPEIQKIIERNKEELRKTHELHQSDLRLKREQLAEEYEKKMADLREKLSNERDNAVDKERERAQQKLHEQYERLEGQF